MAAWIFLSCAIVLEVVGTSLLRVAAAGRTILYVPVTLAYAGALMLLSMTLRNGMPLGVAYGTWAALGVALTALVARVLFKERLSLASVGGIALIMCGVLTVELARPHGPPTPHTTRDAFASDSMQRVSRLSGMTMPSVTPGRNHFAQIQSEQVHCAL